MTEKDCSGAESLVQTLVDSGVRVCFANPGTSEMHFVAALDTHPEMRCILGLFEGVVTGAADGYARMHGLPAATLTHLGPGLGNGLANLHNAKKARTPVVNIIGDHATYHRQYDAPLTSDVEGIAGPVSNWVRVSGSADEVASDGAEAVQAAMTPPGQVASLILPADTAWNRTRVTARPLAAIKPRAPDPGQVDAAARALKSGEPATLLMNGILTEERLALASRISRATGVRVMSDTFVPRIQRGAGRADHARLPYFGEQAADALAGCRHLILVSTQPPVSFFAYPEKPSWLTPENCQLHSLVEWGGDVDQALSDLADAVGAGRLAPELLQAVKPDSPKGELNARTLGLALAQQFPEEAIVVDEGGISGLGIFDACRNAPPHDWLILTGGSIGYGIPAAVGAAAACPERRVLSLQADGAGMYTLQGLWTQAREQQNVTTIVLSNRKYAILQIEFARVGAHNPGPKAMSMLDLGNPELDWVSLANGLGVPGRRAAGLQEFSAALNWSLNEPGPSLIEAVLP